MNITVETRPLAEIDSDALVVIGFEGGPPETPEVSRVKELYDSGEFTGKVLDVSILHAPAGLKAKRLVLAGGGKREKFASPDLRRVSGTVLRTLKNKRVHSIT